MAIMLAAWMAVQAAGGGQDARVPAMLALAASTPAGSGLESLLMGALGLLGGGGLGALVIQMRSYRRDDTGKVISQQDVVFDNAMQLNGDLRIERDDLRRRVTELEAEVERLRVEVRELRSRDAR